MSSDPYSHGSSLFRPVIPQLSWSCRRWAPPDKLPACPAASCSSFVYNQSATKLKPLLLRILWVLAPKHRWTMHPDTPKKLQRNTTKSPRCPPGLLNSPYPNPIEHLWDVPGNESDPWRLHSPTRRTQRIHNKCPGARHSRTPAEVLTPCLDWSELFLAAQGEPAKNGVVLKK